MKEQGGDLQIHYILPTGRIVKLNKNRLFGKELYCMSTVPCSIGLIWVEAIVTLIFSQSI